MGVRFLQFAGTVAEVWERRSFPSRVFLICLLQRVYVCYSYSFGTDPNGQPISTSPLSMFPFLLIPQVLSISALWAIWQLIDHVGSVSSQMKGRVTFLIVLSLLMILNQVNAEMLRYLGQPLSLSTLRVHFQPGILTSDLTQPLSADGSHMAVSVLVTLAFIGGLVSVVVTAGRKQQGSSRVGIYVCLLIASIWITCNCYCLDSSRGSSANLKPCRVGRILLPFEVALLKRVMGTQVLSSADMLLGRAMLLKYKKSQHELVIDPEFPLRSVPSEKSYRQRHPKVESSTPPDIVVVSIESLRAIDTGFQSYRPSEFVTPFLSKLSKQPGSVLFPHFTSCGWPSREGFFCLQSSAWPHMSHMLTLDFQEVSFDSLPSRLREHGNYSTVFVTGCNPSFDNQLYWVRKWYDDVIQRLDQTLFLDVWSTDELVDQAISHVRKHDRLHAGRAKRKPLFMNLVTADTHHPFLGTKGWPSEDLAALSSNIHTRYQQSLAKTDHALERFYEFMTLERDSNVGRETVFIFTGDHGFSAGELPAEGTRGYPCNEYVWTGGLFHVPSKQAASKYFHTETPLVVSSPASQADIFPTIIRAILGVDEALSMVGRNLFYNLSVEAHETPPTISVNSGTFRANFYNNCSLYSDGTPSGSWHERSFGSPACTGKSRESTCPEPVTGSHGIEGASELYAMIMYYSSIIEKDRVAPRQRLNTVVSARSDVAAYHSIVVLSTWVIVLIVVVKVWPAVLLKVVCRRAPKTKLAASCSKSLL